MGKKKSEIRMSKSETNSNTEERKQEKAKQERGRERQKRQRQTCENTAGLLVSKPYDLEERSYLFAKQVREFVKELPATICNHCDVPQLVRASGSIAANYIEANESLG
jgi:hypothetical protein